MNLNQFKEKFNESISLEEKLSGFTWFGTGGNAEILFIPKEEKKLEKFLKEKPHTCNVFTMGAGSNLLISDNGISGITLVTKKLKTITIDKHGVITAQSGATDAEVARFARNHNRTGL